MSMRDQLVTDLREVVFNTDDFGHSVTYKPATGSQYSMTGMFDDSFAEVDPNSGAVVTSTNPKFLTAQAFIVSGPKKGDQLIFAGVTYNVVQPRPRGLHLVDLILHKA